MRLLPFILYINFLFLRNVKTLKIKHSYDFKKNNCQ